MPENVAIEYQDASMGPERKAPENKTAIFEYYVEKMLQWGRSERLRKTPKDNPHQRNRRGFNGAGAKGSGKRLVEFDFDGRACVASMGPERKAPENQDLFERSYERESWLQWGRSERLRKTTQRQRGQRVVWRASMGPERKAPENPMTAFDYETSGLLQWGRSERLRKTRSRW